MPSGVILPCWRRHRGDPTPLPASSSCLPVKTVCNGDVIGVITLLEALPWNQVRCGEHLVCGGVVDLERATFLVSLELLVVHPFGTGHSVDGESSRSNLHIQKYCRATYVCLPPGIGAAYVSLFRAYRSSQVSSMFVDMLVAARYKTTVVGVHFGSSEGARVPARVCCGVLAFRRFCMCCDALVLG